MLTFCHKIRAMAASSICILSSAPRTQFMAKVWSLCRPGIPLVSGVKCFFFPFDIKVAWRVDKERNNLVHVSQIESKPNQMRTYILRNPNTGSWYISMYQKNPIHIYIWNIQIHIRIIHLVFIHHCRTGKISGDITIRTGGLIVGSKSYHVSIAS